MTTNQDPRDAAAIQEAEHHGDPAHEDVLYLVTENLSPENDQPRVRPSLFLVSAIFNVGPDCYSSKRIP